MFKMSLSSQINSKNVDLLPNGIIRSTLDILSVYGKNGQKSLFCQIFMYDLF